MTDDGYKRDKNRTFIKSNKDRKLWRAMNMKDVKGHCT